MNHLRWAAMFVIVSGIAGLLGFTDIAGTSAWVATVFFVAFSLVVFVLWYLGGDADNRINRGS